MFGKRRSQAAPLDVELQPLTQAASIVPGSAASIPISPSHRNNTATTTSAATRSPVSPPVGKWKDSLWSWCRHGPCHATIFNSICGCSLTGAGQVASRLQLTYAGQVGSISQAAVAFKTLLRTTILFWTTRTILLIIIALLDPNIESRHWVEPPTSYYFVCAVDDLLAYIYFGFTVICLRNMRSHARHKYSIPEETKCCPAGCEDTCCSIFCPCLVVSQLLRHTTDYSAYPGRCCSSTGLSYNVPATLV